MKHEKAQDILPKDLIELIQKYIDGGYLYIPRKSNNKKSWGESSGLKHEIKKRNIEIYNRYRKSISIKQLSKEYYLSESSIRRIIYQCRSGKIDI
ncbi:CD3324 family protein [Clostridium hydrogeniformans]|uniref:CD3324 family protein n=1 Tax=Clostridium hydrogeniformans TaxID=349933 RepID=UPI0004898414|nr:CD3324 family protein [Clostridium hydrogeniformans]